QARSGAHDRARQDGDRDPEPRRNRWCEGGRGVLRLACPGRSDPPGTARGHVQRAPPAGGATAPTALGRAGSRAGGALLRPASGYAEDTDGVVRGGGAPGRGRRPGLCRAGGVRFGRRFLCDDRAGAAGLRAGRIGAGGLCLLHDGGRGGPPGRGGAEREVRSGQGYLPTGTFTLVFSHSKTSAVASPAGGSARMVNISTAGLTASAFTLARPTSWLFTTSV